jgi:TP901 family phage tail tape measure protein
MNLDGKLVIGADVTPALNEIVRMAGKLPPFKIRVDTRNFPLGSMAKSADQFAQSIQAANQRVLAFGASAGTIYAIEKAFRFLVSSTIEVEKRLTEINVILGASSSNLKQFSNELFNIAKTTGQSFDEVSKAALEFSRQGLGVTETLKRTRDALILTRQTGIDVGEAVSAITATLNSFTKAAYDSTTVINKLAKVDQNFAVSAGDLVEAIKRVGSSAEDAGVSLDELIAMVTSAQQITARGGSVIGNAYKTIFTRLQRPEVLNQLEEIGVAVRDNSNAILPAIKILENFSKSYDNLNQSQKSAATELVGSVYQINVLKAGLKDLGSSYSFYERALNDSASATDEAILRNEKMNKSIAAMVNSTKESWKQLSADIGEQAIGPAIKRALGAFDFAAGGLSELFSKNKGSGEQSVNIGKDIGQGILKGLSQFIEGPGLALVGLVMFRFAKTFTKFAIDSAKVVGELNKNIENRAILESEIATVLAQQPKIYERLLSGEITREQAEREVLTIIRNQNAALDIQKGIITSMGTSISTRGAAAVTRDKKVVVAASRGYIPNFANPVLTERAGAYKAGYVPGKVKLFENKVINDAERVIPPSNLKNLGSTANTSAIVPPLASPAGQVYKAAFKTMSGVDLATGQKGFMYGRNYFQREWIKSTAKNRKLSVNDPDVIMTLGKEFANKYGTKQGFLAVNKGFVPNFAQYQYPTIAAIRKQRPQLGDILKNAPTVWGQATGQRFLNHDLTGDKIPISYRDNINLGDMMNNILAKGKFRASEGFVPSFASFKEYKGIGLTARVPDSEILDPEAASKFAQKLSLDGNVSTLLKVIRKVAPKSPALEDNSLKFEVNSGLRFGNDFKASGLYQSDNDTISISSSARSQTLAHEMGHMVDISSFSDFYKQSGFSRKKLINALRRDQIKFKSRPYLMTGAFDGDMVRDMLMMYRSPDKRNKEAIADIFADSGRIFNPKMEDYSHKKYLTTGEAPKMIRKGIKKILGLKSSGFIPNFGPIKDPYKVNPIYHVLETIRKSSGSDYQNNWGEPINYDERQEENKRLIASVKSIGFAGYGIKSDNKDYQIGSMFAPYAITTGYEEKEVAKYIPMDKLKAAGLSERRIYKMLFKGDRLSSRFQQYNDPFSIESSQAKIRRAKEGIAVKKASGNTINLNAATYLASRMKENSQDKWAQQNAISEALNTIVPYPELQSEKQEGKVVKQYLSSGDNKYKRGSLKETKEKLMQYFGIKVNKTDAAGMLSEKRLLRSLGLASRGSPTLAEDRGLELNDYKNNQQRRITVSSKIGQYRKELEIASLVDNPISPAMSLDDYRRYILTHGATPTTPFSRVITQLQRASAKEDKGDRKTNLEYALRSIAGGSVSSTATIRNLPRLNKIFPELKLTNKEIIRAFKNSTYGKIFRPAEQKPSILGQTMESLKAFKGFRSTQAKARLGRGEVKGVTQDMFNSDITPYASFSIIQRETPKNIQDILFNLEKSFADRVSQSKLLFRGSSIIEPMLVNLLGSFTSLGGRTDEKRIRSYLTSSIVKSASYGLSSPIGDKKGVVSIYSRPILENLGLLQSGLVPSNEQANSVVAERLHRKALMGVLNLENGRLLKPKDFMSSVRDIEIPEELIQFNRGLNELASGSIINRASPKITSTPMGGVMNLYRKVETSGMTPRQKDFRGPKTPLPFEDIKGWDSERMVKYLRSSLGDTERGVAPFGSEHSSYFDLRYMSFTDRKMRKDIAEGRVSLQDYSSIIFQRKVPVQELVTPENLGDIMTSGEATKKKIFDRGVFFDLPRFRDKFGISEHTSEREYPFLTTAPAGKVSNFGKIFGLSRSKGYVPNFAYIPGISQLAGRLLTNITHTESYGLKERMDSIKQLKLKDYIGALVKDIPTPAASPKGEVWNTYDRDILFRSVFKLPHRVLMPENQDFLKSRKLVKTSDSTYRLTNKGRILSNALQSLSQGKYAPQPNNPNELYILGQNKTMGGFDFTINKDQNKVGYHDLWDFAKNPWEKFDFKGALSFAGQYAKSVVKNRSFGMTDELRSHPFVAEDNSMYRQSPASMLARMAISPFARPVRVQDSFSPLSKEKVERLQKLKSSSSYGSKRHKVYNQALTDDSLVKQLLELAKNPPPSVGIMNKGFVPNFVLPNKGFLGSPFPFEDFRKLKTLEEQYKFIKSEFPKVGLANHPIGEGSSRAVYGIGGNMVLKMVKDTKHIIDGYKSHPLNEAIRQKVLLKGFAQNQTEGSQMFAGFRDIVPYNYEVDDRFKYIIAERAAAMTQANAVKFGYPSVSDALYEPRFRRRLTSLYKTGVIPDEGSKNFGFIRRGGENRPALIDYGLDTQTAKNLYGFTGQDFISKGLIPNFAIEFKDRKRIYKTGFGGDTEFLEKVLSKISPDTSLLQATIHGSRDELLQRVTPAELEEILALKNIPINKDTIAHINIVKTRFGNLPHTFGIQQKLSGSTAPLVVVPSFPDPVINAETGLGTKEGRGTLINTILTRNPRGEGIVRPSVDRFGQIMKILQDKWGNTTEVIGLERARQMFGLNAKRKASGFIPNFADPLKLAIAREIAAGVPASLIKVENHASLKSANNPLGLAVTNKRDEPNGVSQGISRAIREGANPKTYGSGRVPNFADQPRILTGLKGILQSNPATDANFNQGVRDEILEKAKTLVLKMKDSQVPIGELGVQADKAVKQFTKMVAGLTKSQEMIDSFSKSISYWKRENQKNRPSTPLKNQADIGAGLAAQNALEAELQAKRQAQEERTQKRRLDAQSFKEKTITSTVGRINQGEFIPNIRKPILADERVSGALKNQAISVVSDGGFVLSGDRKKYYDWLAKNDKQAFRGAKQMRNANLQNRAFGVSFGASMVGGLASQFIGDATQERRGYSKAVEGGANTLAMGALGFQVAGPAGALALGAVSGWGAVTDTIKAFNDTLPDLQKNLEAVTERSTRTSDAFSKFIQTSEQINSILLSPKPGAARELQRLRTQQSSALADIPDRDSFGKSARQDLLDAFKTGDVNKQIEISERVAKRIGTEKTAAELETGFAEYLDKNKKINSEGFSRIDSFERTLRSSVNKQGLTFDQFLATNPGSLDYIKSSGSAEQMDSRLRELINKFDPSFNTSFSGALNKLFTEEGPLKQNAYKRVFSGATNEQLDSERKALELMNRNQVESAKYIESFGNQVFLTKEKFRSFTDDIVASMERFNANLQAANERIDIFGKGLIDLNEPSLRPEGQLNISQGFRDIQTKAQAQSQFSLIQKQFESAMSAALTKAETQRFDAFEKLMGEKAGVLSGAQQVSNAAYTNVLSGGDLLQKLNNINNRTEVTGGLSEINKINQESIRNTLEEFNKIAREKDSSITALIDTTANKLAALDLTKTLETSRLNLNQKLNYGGGLSEILNGNIKAQMVQLGTSANVANTLRNSTAPGEVAYQRAEILKKFNVEVPESLRKELFTESKKNLTQAGFSIPDEVIQKQIDSTFPKSDPEREAKIIKAMEEMAKLSLAAVNEESLIKQTELSIATQTQINTKNISDGIAQILKDGLKVSESKNTKDSPAPSSFEMPMSWDMPANPMLKYDIGSVSKSIKSKEEEFKKIEDNPVMTVMQREGWSPFAEAKPKKLYTFSDLREMERLQGEIDKDKTTLAKIKLDAARNQISIPFGMSQDWEDSKPSKITPNIGTTKANLGYYGGMAYDLPMPMTPSLPVYNNKNIITLAEIKAKQINAANEKNFGDVIREGPLPISTTDPTARPQAKNTRYAAELRQRIELDAATKDYIASTKELTEAMYGAVGGFTTFNDTIISTQKTLIDFAGSVKEGFHDLIGLAIRGTGDIEERFREMFEEILNKAATNMASSGLDFVFSQVTKGIGVESLFKNKGGYIPRFSEGGVVRGGSGTKDDVLAQLSGGEYVINRSAAEKIGYKNLEAINKGGSSGGPSNWDAFGAAGGADSFINQRSSGITAHLQNAYRYNDPRQPTAGEVVVDPRLSIQALTDMDNPQSRIRMEREENLLNYITDKQDFQKAQDKAQKQYKEGLWWSFGTSLAGAAGNTWAAGAKPNTLGGKDFKGAYDTSTSAEGADWSNPGFEYERFQWDSSVSRRPLTRNSGGSINSKTALLTGGEYVMSPATVSRLGVSRMNTLNAGHVPTFALGGLMGSSNAGSSPDSLKESIDKLVAVSQEIRGTLEGKDTKTGNKDSAPAISNNVNITISVTQTGKVNSDTQVSSGAGASEKEDKNKKQDEYKKLGMMIENKVLEVIVQEQRPGGLLYDSESR